MHPFHTVYNSTVHSYRELYCKYRNCIANNCITDNRCVGELLVKLQKCIIIITYHLYTIILIYLYVNMLYRNKYHCWLGVCNSNIIAFKMYFTKVIIIIY